MCLSLDRVTFGYPGGPVVLKEASLTFKTGSFSLVRGPSGAGKSTLLRLLCRLEEAETGTIIFNDQPIEELVPAELRRSVAYVQQMPTLLPVSVRENLLLPFSFKTNDSRTQPSDDTLIDSLSSFLLAGITLDTEASTLSVGQSQRVCLIRSLLLHPQVLLMDEPTASLDAESACVVLDKAAELSREGVTVIMISHSETTPEGVTDTVSILNRKLEYV